MWRPSKSWICWCREACCGVIQIIWVSLPFSSNWRTLKCLIQQNNICLKKDFRYCWTRYRTGASRGKGIRALFGRDEGHLVRNCAETAALPWKQWAKRLRNTGMPSMALVDHTCIATACRWEAQHTLGPELLRVKGFRKCFLVPSKCLEDKLYTEFWTMCEGVSPGCLHSHGEKQARWGHKSCELFQTRPLGGGEPCPSSLCAVILSPLSVKGTPPWLALRCTSVFTKMNSSFQMLHKTKEVAFIFTVHFSIYFLRQGDE